MIQNCVVLIVLSHYTSTLYRQTGWSRAARRRKSNQKLSSTLQVCFPFFFLLFLSYHLLLQLTYVFGSLLSAFPSQLVLFCLVLTELQASGTSDLRMYPISQSCLPDDTSFAEKRYTTFFFV